MDDNNNIFDALEESSKIEETLVAPNSSPVSLSGNVLPVATATRTTKAPVRKKGRNKLVDELGFRNPGPKNVVTNVSSRRMKNIRRNSTQERTGRSRPVYDNVGLLISDKSDRCDCNRKACPGCFQPCISCLSPKCGLDCRINRCYSYEYRLYGTNKIIKQEK